MLIRLNKANNWILGLLKKTASVNTGVSAPTTATAGQLGDVRFDTDGNKWELKHIDGTTYYWSPDGFPAVNTEYFDCYCGGVKYWKKCITGTLASSGNSTTIAHGVTSFGISKSISAILYLAATQEVESNYYNTTTGYFWAQRSGDNVICGHPATASFFSKPVSVTISYTKTE